MTRLYRSVSSFAFCYGDLGNCFATTFSSLLNILEIATMAVPVAVIRRSRER